MQNTQIKPLFSWSRYGGYECSTKGDTRLNSFNARLADGRSVEEVYQCDVRQKVTGGTNWRLGKGEPPLDTSKDLYAEYKELWRQWVLANFDIFKEVASSALTHYNGVISDMFANGPINQARALSDLMNEFKENLNMLTKTQTHRGFEVLRFKDSYGKNCSLQESSNADGANVWLGISDSEPIIMNRDAKKLGLPTTSDVGWTSYLIPQEVLISTRMHLSQEQVKELLPYLIKFAETGEF